MNITKQCEVEEQDILNIESLNDGSMAFSIYMDNSIKESKVNLSKEDALYIAHEIIDYYTDKLLQIEE